MKVYVSTLYQIYGADTSLVGVFSTAAKAIEEGEKAMNELALLEPPMLDWDHEPPEHRYYYDGFTLIITEATLDQVV